MPFIVKGFVQEKLIPAIDLVKLINQYVPLKRAGASWKGCCPFHNEKTPSFSVSPSRNMYRCFGCNEAGNAIDFIMKYKNIEFVEAVEELAHYAGIEVEYQKSDRNFVNFRDDKSKKLYELMDRAAHFFTSQLELNQAAKDYFLKQRGLSEELILKARLGFAPDSWDYVQKLIARSDEEYKLCVDLGLQTDRYEEGKHIQRSFFRGRVMFPIFDKKGRIIAFGGRVFNNDFGPKYLNSKESAIFKKRIELFGLYETLQAHCNRPKRIVVVEGYMDAIALRQAGFDYVVATLGTAITQEHLKTLFRFTDQVICCFDGDEAGKNATWRAIKAITPVLDNPNKEIRFVNLPEGHDPDTLVRSQGAQAFEKELTMSLSYSECIFMHESKLMDVREPSERIKFINSILSIIKAMKSPPIQIVTMQMLANYVDMPLSSIQTMFENSAIEANNEFMQDYNSQDSMGNDYASHNHVDKGQMHAPVWANNASSNNNMVQFNKKSSSYQAQNDYLSQPYQTQNPNAFASMPQNMAANGIANMEPQSAPYAKNHIANNNNWPPANHIQGQYAPAPSYGPNNQGAFINQGRPIYNGNLAHNTVNYDAPWGKPDLTKARTHDQGMELSAQEISKHASYLNIAREHNSPAGNYMNLGPNGAPLNAGNQMRNVEFNGDYYEGGRGLKGDLMYPINTRNSIDEEGDFYISDKLDSVDLYKNDDPNFTLTMQERSTYKSIVGREFNAKDVCSQSYRLLSFILQYPTIVANYYDLFKLDFVLYMAKELKVIEFPCLQRVLNLIKSKPTITCAGLIEEYRGTEFEPLFNFLSNVEVIQKKESEDNYDELETEAKALYLASFIFYTLIEPFIQRSKYIQSIVQYEHNSKQMLDELYALQEAIKYGSLNDLINALREMDEALNSSNSKQDK